MSRTKSTEMFVIDFEKVLKNYINYHESIKLIETQKRKFSDDIENIKKEMESIINSSRLLIDDKSQLEQATKFKELQAKAIKLESEFRSQIVQTQNIELERNFNELSELVKEWAEKNNIDLVLNKTQTLFVTDNLDATDVIIEILKNKDLFKEESELLTEVEEIV